MNKYNKLAQNTTIFFIANFGSKILTFLLVRFYTEFLTTNEYGTVDLLNTTASMAYPIATMCITEAVLRFSIDDIANRGKILTNGLLFTLLGNFAFVLTAPIFASIDVFAENVAWIYFLTLSNSLYTIVSHFSRGIGKTKLFAAAGVIHTVLQLGLNILLLVVCSLGIKGYLIAAVLANVLSCVYVFVAGKLHQYILRQIDKKYLKTMLVYSIPLIPNSIFWWIMQSADRYVIVYMLSSAENGLYAVANKIPTLITTISSIFFQAWQLSAVEEAQSDRKNQFYTNVFQALSMILLLATSFIMVILRPLYYVLTEESYRIGWTCTPFLLCAMVYSCYSSFLGTNYMAMKKTKAVFLTTVLGAVLNIGLNILLIPIMGIEGAALATFAAYFVTWVSRIIGTRHFVEIRYPFVTFWLPSILTLCQAILLTAGIDLVYVQFAIFAVILAIYAKEIIRYAKLVLHLIGKKRGADR